MIRAYAKKYGTRTYQPGEQVVVDVGTRSKVKNTREALEAEIVAPIEGGEYRVQFQEGELAGGQFYADYSRIEPLEVPAPTIELSTHKKKPKTTLPTSKTCEVTMPRKKYHGLRDVTKKMKTRSNGLRWRPVRKAAIDEIQFNNNNIIVNNIVNTSDATKDLPENLDSRSSSHLWKLACAGQLLENTNEVPLTRIRARRNNNN